MATLHDFRDERIRKLKKIKEIGINPYPSTMLGAVERLKAARILEDFDNLNGETVTVAGRITGIRKFGKIAFLVIKDDSESMQLFMRSDHIEALNVGRGTIGMEQLPLLDTGDFIGASGAVIKTQTGETSIDVVKLQLLAKAIRPMPLTHEEFSDKEERLRRRYVDINVNKDVHDRFVRRSKFWQATRRFLLEHGFIEINIPVLEHTTGGADANPFITHMDALDQDFYLRISHELPLKRLIGAGYERVFDIGPRFRNEGVDEEHLPEHIAMESYAAYQDYEDGMEFYEAMIKYVAKETWGTLEFEHNGMKVNLDSEWPRVSYADIMKEKFDIDVFSPNREQLKKILTDNKVDFDHNTTVVHLLDSVWKLIRRESAGPFWLIQEPAEISPLAKRDSVDPRVTQRFHPIILGTEMGNGFSELNDPLDQLNRFVEQQKMRDKGDREAMMLDIDFVEMLEYGMPPTCGWGNSERNFWLLEGVSGREGVPFPHMRHEISEVTREVYKDLIL